MKHTRFLTAFLLLFATLASGCSTVAVIKTSDGELSKDAQYVSASAVKVYCVKDIGVPYTVLGSVVASADAFDNSYLPVKLLCEEAARLGADAVVGLRLEIQDGFWTNGIRASGVAVKLNKGEQGNATAN